MLAVADGLASSSGMEYTLAVSKNCLFYYFLSRVISTFNFFMLLQYHAVVNSVFSIFERKIIKFAENSTLIINYIYWKTLPNAYSA